MPIKFGLISIIIPTYNRSSLLTEAVQSCLDQTYDQIEILIIDDGSTDATEVMVNEQLETTWYSRNIKYVKQANAGASAARNLGLEIAKGDYIQFLDSDDLLYPQKLSLQMQSMLATGADGCMSYGAMGPVLNSNSEILGVAFTSVKDLMHKMCSGRVHVMCTPAPLWKKSAIEQTGGWNTDLAFGDDLEFHIRVLSSFSKMDFVPEELFFVRDHSGERLSDVSLSTAQITSGISTQQLVATILQKKGLWDKEFQRGILKNARTLYANYLLLADRRKLNSYEKWLWGIARNPVCRIDILGLITARKIFGQKFILRLYKMFK